MKSQPIKSVMFHANDALSHDVAWGPVAKEYLFENRDGLICTSPNLQNLLGLMWLACGNSSEDWSVTDNPYGE